MKATHKVSATMYRVLQVLHEAGDPIPHRQVQQGFGDTPCAQAVEDCIAARLVTHPPKLVGDDAGKVDPKLITLSSSGRVVLAKQRDLALADVDDMIRAKQQIMKDRRADETDQAAVDAEVERLKRFKKLIEGGKRVYDDSAVDVVPGAVRKKTKRRAAEPKPEPVEAT